MTDKVDLGKVYNDVVDLLAESKIDSWDVVSLMEYVKMQALNQIEESAKNTDKLK